MSQEKRGIAPLLHQTAKLAEDDKNLADTVNAWNQRAQKGAPLPDEKSQERARTMCGHARSENARAAAHARHRQPGGSVAKQNEIREIWASGKYKSRDTCAKDECDAIGMSYSTARKALRGMPEPKRADGMTARKIVIRDCGECQHRARSWVRCEHGNCALKGRIVPETGIPDWCPLPKDANDAQYPTLVQLSDEQTANAVLLAYMLTSVDRFGILMPSCQFAPQKLQDVAPGIVDGIELTEAGKALKQRMVQMMHDARVKGSA